MQTERTPSPASQKSEHTLHLSDRSALLVTGVTDIVSFEENGVLLSTAMGILSVDGSELRVERLDPDRKEVALSGTVNGIFYVDGADGKRKRRR